MRGIRQTTTGPRRDTYERDRCAVASFPDPPPPPVRSSRAGRGTPAREAVRRMTDGPAAGPRDPGEDPRKVVPGVPARSPPSRTWRTSKAARVHSRVTLPGGAPLALLTGTVEVPG
ncbi:hypothetical protein GCM10010238_51280 [Streptomyces griseoviridis]|uniref:Uncharacterized protein n=1 Tax=Streptomyces griseoviridis TaxID=45398 RepID=A0A918LJ63_STRGD|nr:hypothetical protein GCM10010238_51280 [Streptomyces niveoruber]